MEINTRKMIMLNGTNYQLWRNKMKDLLFVKALHISFFATQKPDSKSDEEWEFEHQQVCGFIRQFVEENIYNHIDQEIHARTLWEKHESLYSSKSGNNGLFLLKKMMALKYKEGTNISDHGIITLDLAKSDVLNEEVRRISQGSTSQSEVLVTENRGRSREKDGNLVCDETSWVIYTSALIHVTSRRDFLTSYTHSDFGVLKMRNDGLVPVTSMGDVSLVSNNDTKLILKDVRHAPNIHLNLISTGKLDDEAKKNQLSRLKNATLKNFAHCLAGKQRRVSFSSHPPHRKSELLELVHSNVCGPIKVRSHGGALYFVTFIDDCSRKLWVYTLK
ncbi:hypothetical protein V6N11_071300 [Hibiscus sabdariffa]|uniref:Retrovirus-related Pol polyprotein from transposon TNT 1-94-like beta-barrel domain-containing protein n=1 Tax=Hibiscus sabdariffa TaxID=183260 RepID=A0ABR2TZY2_9ROSI